MSTRQSFQLTFVPGDEPAPLCRICVPFPHDFVAHYLLFIASLTTTWRRKITPAATSLYYNSSTTQCDPISQWYHCVVHTMMMLMIMMILAFSNTQEFSVTSHTHPFLRVEFQEEKCSSSTKRINFRCVEMKSAFGAAARAPHALPYHDVCIAWLEAARKSL